MNSPSSSLEMLRKAFAAPTRAILGLVDDLLTVSREHGLQLDWKANQCRVRFLDGAQREWVEFPLRKSAVRAALARVAVLCSQHLPNSVSPYGGEGQICAGADPATPMRVRFANTPDEQTLELIPIRTEGMPTVREAASRHGSASHKVTSA